MFATLSCKAQIIPIEQQLTYTGDIPDGAYVKDVNGLLNDYVGTWATTQNGDRYEFQIVKVTKNYLNTTWDKLYMRYKIFNISTGKVLVDVTSETDDSPFVVRGAYLASTGTHYVLNYIGHNNDCGQNGHVFIEVVGSSKNQMNIFLSVTGDVSPNCTSPVTTQILPIQKMLLTKQ